MRLLLCSVALLLLGQEEDWPARVRRLSARVEKIRALEFKSPLGHREGSRKEYAARALESIRSIYGKDLEAAQKCLRELGLMSRSMSLKVAVTGFAYARVQVYHEKGKIVHPRDEEGDDLVANKIAAGLVDQHFPEPTVPGTFDARMAVASLRQGDAEIVKHMFWKSKTGDEPIADGYAGKLADEAANWERDGSKWAGILVPRFFVRGSAFPWRRGPVFVETLRSKGGWKAVSEAHGKPPVSTEQILHPGKYPDDVPVQIDTAPFEKAAAKAGYALRYVTTLGELGALILLESHDAKKDHSESGAGWGGDRLLYFEKGDAPLILWATVWDTAEDAVQFHTALNPVSLKLSTPGMKEFNFVLRRGTSVAFLHRLPADGRDDLVDALWKCRKKVGEFQPYGE